MKEYSVWSEGFKITGGESQAAFYGKIEANSFKEACQKVFEKNDTFDPQRMTLWGCRLFDNEKAARKSFG